MIKKFRNSKNIFCILTVLLFMFSQLFFINGITVKADSNFSVQVVVEGNSGVIASGTSAKANAYDALKEVLGSKTLDVSKHFINKIDTISNDTTNWDKYWMIAVNRNSAYQDVNEGIDQLTLNSGDKLIVYYSSPSTVTANDITFSTKVPNKPLTISLNNLSQDWNTGKDVVTPISNVSVKLDGKAVTLNDNKIQLDSGLALGTHSIELSDYSTSGMPKVVADTLQFTMDPKCTVRVEGITDTIVNNTAEGTNALEIFKNALDAGKISYTVSSGQYGSYIESINGIGAGKYGQYSGWCYYVKNANKIVSPSVSMDNYVPEDGDSIIVYYSDGSVPFVNEITFAPSVVKPNESFVMNFAYNYLDYTTNKNVSQPIKNAKVQIDSTNYTTDDNGQIIVKGLAAGNHSYKISGYNNEALSTVVMDNGSFTIDGVNSPSFNGSTTQYDAGQDNSNVIKNMPEEISSTANVVKTYNDAFSAADLYNLGLSGSINTDFIKDAAVKAKNEGVKNLTNTELEKLIIGLSASGYTPYDFEGQNIAKELYNRDINDFMINDLDFGLIAYNYANISGSYKITKDALKAAILTKLVTVNSLSGWSYTGKTVDGDMTGITINALSGFYNTDSKVQSAVNSAVKSLSKMQNINGYIPGQYGICPETNAFAILGLTSIGVNPEGASDLNDGSSVSFSKLNGDLVSALLSFKAGDGQYKHLISDTSGNAISTEEALRALIAVNKYRISKLYNYYSTNIDCSKLKTYDLNIAVENDIQNAITQGKNTVAVPNLATDEYSAVISIPISLLKTAAAGNVNEVTVSCDDTEVIVRSDIIDFSKYVSGDLSDYTLKVSKTDASEADSNTALSYVPQGLKIAGTVFDLNMIIQDSNGNDAAHVHNFADGKKVKVSIKINPDEADISKLAAYYFNTNTNSWEYIGGSYDSSTKIFSFETTHFSRFALFQGSAVTNSSASSNSTTSEQQNTAVSNLPKTGSYIIDTQTLVLFGILMIVLGGVMLKVSMKKNKE